MLHPKMRDRSKEKWIMQDVKDENILFAKFKTRFKILLKIEKTSVLWIVNQKRMYMFFNIMNEIWENGVYVCWRSSTKMKEKCYLIRVISKKYERSQEIKWFESRPKNQEKWTLWFELSFMWFNIIRVKKTSNLNHIHKTKIQKILPQFESSQALCDSNQTSQI